MKKLMIAAAAASAAVGAYATTGCEGCAVDVKVNPQDTIEVVVNPCSVTAYNVKFNLKTLVSKGVKTGDCQGYCMEQGNRTLEGILWSCCTQCENWGNDPDMTNVGGDEEPFQYTLWEKSTKKCFTGGMVHVNSSKGTSTATFNVPYTTRMYNDTKKAITLGLKGVENVWNSMAEGEAFVENYNRTVENVLYKSKLAYFGKNLWKAEGTLTKPGEKTVDVVEYGFSSKADADKWIADYEVEAGWTKNLVSSIYQQVRYEYATVAAGGSITIDGYVAQNVKDQAAADAKAKAETALSSKYIYLTTEGTLTAAPAQAVANWGARTAGTPSTTEDTISKYYDTDASIQVYRFSKKANKAEALWTIDTEEEGVDNGFKSEDAEVYLVAAGFGSTTVDGDDIVVSSLSGNCAGTIVPAEISADCAGSICDMCEEFSSWCTDGFTATQPTTFVSGTWTMKYIKKLSKGFEGVVPSYAGINYL